VSIFLQLTSAKKTEIKNLCRAATGLVICVLQQLV